MVFDESGACIREPALFFSEIYRRPVGAPSGYLSGEKASEGFRGRELFLIAVGVQVFFCETSFIFISFCLI